MSQNIEGASIGQVQNQDVRQIDEAAVPNPELGHVGKPSRWALAGRIMLGIVTLGLSEGIRAIVRACSSRPAAAPRINVEEPVRVYTYMDISEGLADQINSQLIHPLDQDELNVLNSQSFHKLGDKVVYAGIDAKKNRLAESKLPALHAGMRSALVQCKVGMLNMIEKLGWPDAIKKQLRADLIADSGIKNAGQLSTMLNLAKGCKVGYLIKAIHTNVKAMEKAGGDAEAEDAAAMDIAEEIMAMAEGPVAKMNARSQKLNLDGPDDRMMCYSVMCYAILNSNPKLLKAIKGLPESTKEKITDILSNAVTASNELVYQEKIGFGHALMACVERIE